MGGDRDTCEKKIFRVQGYGVYALPFLLAALVSAQNEFRIDSSRLQPEDKGMMFRLMSFFMSFHHQLHKAAVTDAVEAGRKGADLPKFELGHVLETMDLMSFNLVLREAEAAISEKAPKRLVECVAVLKEMMHIVVSGLQILVVHLHWVVSQRRQCCVTLFG